MKPERGGIKRLAPLLALSLLLHLAVLFAAIGIFGPEPSSHKPGPPLTVEYIEPPKRQERPLQETKSLPVPAKRARQEPARPKPTPPKVPPAAKKKPELPPPLPPAKPKAAAPAVPRTVPGPSPPVRTAPPVAPPSPGVAPLSPGGSGEMAVGTVGGPGKGTASGSGARQGTGTGTGHQGGAGATRGGTPSGTWQQGRAAYGAMLKRLIEAHKQYPFAASRARQEGSCVRRFTISRSGALKNVEAVSSCGYPFLDEAATRAITSIGKFPPLPEEIRGAEATFDIVIKFTLAK